uniref:Serine/threonine-protein kinase Nek4 n=2 Tax=Cyprinus carpio TaxID=7962 RepID=A0A8C1CAD4_CYPCA
MNSYLFVRVVGKGSYGEVNLVRHKSDRKQYVIKKLNLRTSSRRERRAAEQEAQLLSQLKHPNIVTYRESWEGEDCQLYIVMGFCEGGDLYHRLKQQKGELLPERQVVEWFVQIAMALQYLHEKHILHRDLKTQNIFLTKTSIIKVGDLGIARVLESQNDMASTLIGTPYYMSPELFSNKPYNYKSDVWALGCCVYEMATLKHAFNAKDMNSLVYRIVEGKLPQMPSKYDPQLGELIKRMLCKKPEDRPDVKHILRQPYIKQQISRFLEATKEKTAKSRKNAANSKPNSAGSDASAKPNHDVVQPQCLHSESKARGRKALWNHSKKMLSDITSDTCSSLVLFVYQERKCSWRQSDEDDCSSSTSSTERSEGDFGERKFETNEMQDFVQMMTQTLHMDARDVSFEPDGSRCHSTPLPEFKLNRKYRDTLMLHGKTREGQGDNQISGFPLDDSTGPAKVRRVIEHLRTDVVKGLGVKLLDRVLDIMQQEDEEKREHLLQELMGEEKYKQYAMKVQQLKFFEDVAFKD